MAQCAQYMGVNVSASEAKLLWFAQECHSPEVFPEHQRRYVAARLSEAAMLLEDIYRVVDWKMTHG